jgi:hypothetical protein
MRRLILLAMVSDLAITRTQVIRQMDNILFGRYCIANPIQQRQHCSIRPDPIFLAFYGTGTIG